MRISSLVPAAARQPSDDKYGRMAGAPASAIGETASLVNRKHSFAVSGTPVRGKLSDLKGLFKFLKFGLGDSAQGFDNLLRHPDLFAHVFSKIAIRAVKSAVQHELFIPTQTRCIVPLDFDPIERTSYRS